MKDESRLNYATDQRYKEVSMRRDVGMCYLALLGVTGLGLVNLIPVSAHMIIAATVVIYIGAHGSVPLLQQSGIHAHDDKCAQCRADQASGKTNAASQPQAEQMQTKDAMMFPVYGSCVLFGLYLTFKLVPKEYITVLMKLYFFVIGVLVLGHRIKQIASAFISHARLHEIDIKVFRLVLPKLPRMPWEKVPTEAEAAAAAAALAATPGGDGGEDVTQFDIACYIASLAIGASYLYWNHWAISNLFGVCFCIQGIELIGLGSYFNGVILLCGLFIYDVFWVFGTDVMVTVAKGFDAPIKLMFPQLDPTVNHSMLGLGDIVIPGIFLALILRFDFSLKTDEKPDEVKRSYFITVLVAYVFGLLATVLVMYAFNAAQPALLYLVPACLASSMGFAAYNKQFKQLWTFKEEPTDAAAGGAASPTAAAAAAGTPPRTR